MKFLQKIYSQIRNLKPPYPGLLYKIENGKKFWEGTLAFTAIFDSIRVKDRFEISIELPARPGEFPMVREIGGRSQAILSAGKVKQLIDLHINPAGGTICLCPKPEEKRRFPGKINLSQFIKELVIPYFFAVHRFEKTGKWQWGQYSHGQPGIAEYYLDRRKDNNPTLLSDCLKGVGLYNTSGGKLKKNIQINGRELCICGSRLKSKKCHPKALDGLRALLTDAQKAGF